ncbi:hypothetical protein HYT23_06605 [Candidatus Pacearchaeota archaeon]|nr:hypothetical protein [Candidatus Pacearchaeota archaeon]
MKRRLVLKKGKIHSTGSPGHVIHLSIKIVSWLKPFCRKIEIAGSVRRKSKTPVDIDVVLVPKDKEKIISFLKTKGRFLQGGGKKASFRIQKVKVELYFTTPESFGATLLAYSSKFGSAIGLRVVARKKGFKLNQYGLFDRKTKRYIAGRTEEDIYHALGREYKEPWNR